MSCDNGHVGPVYMHLVTTTRIEIDPHTLLPTDEAEAEIVEQSRDGWECAACGLFTSHPFHVSSED